MCSQMLVIGTSILWGQGLLEEEKIYTLVKKMVEERGLVADGKLTLCQLSHSGASIGYNHDDTEDTKQLPRIAGEVPTIYPTLLQQLHEYDEQHAEPTDTVRLILIEGGINDIGLQNILNPLVSTHTLGKQIEHHCYRHMKLFLRRVADKFPAAKIIVTAYYRFITEASATELIHGFVAAMGGLPGKLDDKILDMLGDLEKSRIIENCDFFTRESTRAFQRAIDEINHDIAPGQTPRLMLAVPDIQPHSAAFTGNPFIFGMNEDGTPQDSLVEERCIACEEAGFPRTVVPICKMASAGHPNQIGALVYAESIVALLEQRPTREFETYFKIGTVRDLHKDGVWFRDKDQRYVLFRGMNIATRSKLPPYVPILPLDVTEIDWTSTDERGLPLQFVRELDLLNVDLTRLQRLGINAVRLVIMWKALEPQPNPDPEQLSPEGQRYLRLVKEMIELLYSCGMFVILDFHQDLAHEVYGGDGFPDWAIAIDDKHKKPDKPAPSPKWMLRYYDTMLTTLDKLVRHTLQSFWRDDVHNDELSPETVTRTQANKARTHFEKTIGAVARYFMEQNSPAILGYEPFNEPQAVGLGTEAFETEILPTFYKNALAEIRKSDPAGFLFVEPRVDWATFDPKGPEFDNLKMTDHPVSLLDVSNIDDDRVVFSFHFYDNETYVKGEPSLFPPNIAHGVDMKHKQNQWPDFFRQLRAAATSRKLIPFLTEFGGDQDWTFHTDLRPDVYRNQQIRAYMDLEFQQIEALLLNAAYWDYDFYNTEQGKNNWNDENSSLLGPNRTPRNLDIVARMYPLRSSAEPEFLCFDIGTGHGVLILAGIPVAAPTVIYVPAEMHYPNGFEVRATSPDIAWDAERQLLFWKPDPNATEHQIMISPRHAFKQSVLPEPAFDLFSVAVYFWASADAT